MKITGMKWKDLKEETKQFLLEDAVTSDGDCNVVLNGECIVDLTSTLSVTGEVIDGEIVIDDNAIIYNPEEGIKPLSYSDRMKFIKQNKVINNVMTVNEASEKWGITEGTIRAAIKRKDFVLGIDFRKAGRITLITAEAMIRVYGELEE